MNWILCIMCLRRRLRDNWVFVFQSKTINKKTPHANVAKLAAPTVSLCFRKTLYFQGLDSCVEFRNIRTLRKWEGEGTKSANPALILCTFPFLSAKTRQPPTWYHVNKSISQAIFHTPPLSTNTNAPGDKMNTWRVKSDDGLVAL